MIPGCLAFSWPGGLLVLGYSKRDTLVVPEGWSERKLLKHGDSFMRFLGGTAESPAQTRRFSKICGGGPGRNGFAM